MAQYINRSSIWILSHKKNILYTTENGSAMKQFPIGFKIQHLHQQLHLHCLLPHPLHHLPPLPHLASLFPAFLGIC